MAKYFWCRDCDVKWSGDDSCCWACGKDLATGVRDAGPEYFINSQYGWDG